MKFSYTAAEVTEKEIFDTSQQLAPYIDRLVEITKDPQYKENESFINLPFDEQTIKEIIELKQKLTSSKLKYLIVVGIGGSDLGAKAVYDALHGYYDLEEPHRFPKVIFLETLNDKFMEKLKKFIDENVKDPEEILINAISKSGTTVETNVDLEYLLANVPIVKERLVFTSVYDTSFWKKCKEDGAYCLTMPKSIGGRYSFFTTVGLFPLACANIDIIEMARGAMEMRKACIDRDITKNPAALSAAATYLNYKNGKIANNFFAFHPELETLGKWYRQLVGESLGKETDLDGKVVNAGILPIVSVGTTDLHSVGQLYLSGPKNIFTTFVYCEGITAQKYLKAILEGVRQTYAKRHLPFTDIIMSDMSPLELGKVMQFKMMEIIYLAKLMNVNAFDQPNVEEYKAEARKYLEK